MKKLEYLDKRDDKGVMLRYSAYELAYDISYKALDFIKTREVYNTLINVIPQRYVDLYYLKMIFEAFLPIASQLVIYWHDKQNYGNVPIKAINANGFPCQALLHKIWPEETVDFSFSPSYQFKSNAKKMAKTFLHGINSVNSRFHPLDNRFKQDLHCPNVAFNYQEGFDFNKRSDIYWFENSGIIPESIIVYFENPHMMIRHDDEQTAQEFFHKLGIKQLQLWKWYAPTKKDVYSEIITNLKLNKESDEIKKWIKKTAINLCKRSSFWTKFFEQYGIKIHLDPTEYGVEIIFKQIAINHLDGLSIGKVRSYPATFDGAFFGYYPNDIFFAWGEDSARAIQNLNSPVEKILISGFPYHTKGQVQENETSFKDFRANSVKTKFNILLLDTNHSLNEGILQFIPTADMVLFYKVILDWVLEDEEIGLVIKPKKSNFLDQLPDILKQIHDLENKTGRSILVNDSFQKIPSSYLNGIDMVVGTAAFIPSAIIECAIAETRAIMYDYPNLRHHEPDLYKWGENKVLFSDLDMMITALKAYKNDPSSQPKLGNWTNKLNDFDPFRDQKGSQRIGNYIRWIQEGYNAGKDRDIIIESANRKYAESWGKDKIYKE